VPTGSHRHPGHRASTRDGPSRFVSQCGRLVSPSGHNQGCVVVDGHLERFTSPSTTTNPLHHPNGHSNGPTPPPTPPREDAQARQRNRPHPLRVPFLPSAWAKPQPQVSRRTRKRDPPTQTSGLGAIRILPTELVVVRVLLDACGYLWQVDGRKGARKPPPPEVSRPARTRPSTEVSRPARTTPQLRPSSEDRGQRPANAPRNPKARPEPQTTAPPRCPPVPDSDPHAKRQATARTAPEAPQPPPQPARPANSGHCRPGAVPGPGSESTIGTRHPGLGRAPMR
jgi:hypothetical protein